jgi:hypothetical protein
MKGGAPLPFFARVSFHCGCPAFPCKSINLKNLIAGLLHDGRLADPNHFANAQKLDSVRRRKLILLVDVPPQEVDFCTPHRGPTLFL